MSDFMLWLVLLFLHSFGFFAFSAAIDHFYILWGRIAFFFARQTRNGARGFGGGWGCGIWGVLRFFTPT